MKKKEIRKLLLQKWHGSKITYRCILCKSSTKEPDNDCPVCLAIKELNR